MKLDIRTKKQDATIGNYIQDTPRRCTFVLSTGFGKSRVAIEILKRLDPPEIIILVNSEILRDITWRQEFEYFDALDLWDRVRIETYQLVYKWKRESEPIHKDALVVADEVDFAGGTNRLGNFFLEYPEIRVLGLTGFITESKKPWFNEHLPIYTTYTTYQAQMDGLLNKVRVTVVKFMLSDHRHREVRYLDKYGKQRSFKQSDNDSYQFHQKEIERISGKKAAAKQEYLTGSITSSELERKLKSLDYLYNRAAMKRREVLLSSLANIELAKKLYEYNSKLGKKSIVFSKRTDNATAIGGKERSYHGKNTKRNNEKVFKKFIEDGDLLCVCGKVDRGATIPGLNVGIFESYFGNDTKAAQRFGRLLRLKPDELAEVYILVPYYNREMKNGTFKVKPTVQLDWAKDMIRSTVVTSSRTWDYR